MQLIKFIVLCWRSYRMARYPEAQFAWTTASTEQGVPQMIVVVAMGREAWRLTDVLADYFSQRGERTKDGK